MCHKACKKVIPTDRAPSICPISTAFKPDRTISAIIEDSKIVIAIIAAGIVSGLKPKFGKPK